MTLFRHSRRMITEPDDFQDAVTGIELKVNFQRRQEQASRVEQFQSPSWALDFGEANVPTRVRGILRDGWASLCIGLGPADAIWNGQHAAQGSLSLLPPLNELDGRTTSGFSWLTLAVPSEVWHECLKLAGCRVEPGSLTVLRLPDQALQPRLRRLLTGRKDLIDGSMDTMHQMKAMVRDTFTLACEQDCRLSWQPESLRNRARMARRAEAWMLDHMDEPLQVPDLCLALGVSRRELEYAFRTIFDVSPRAHLAMLRMHAIRRALLRGDGRSITDIAYAHGVTHLSRFAASYQALFGEKPSETARASSVRGHRGI